MILLQEKNVPYPIILQNNNHPNNNNKIILPKKQKQQKSIEIIQKTLAQSLLRCRDKSTNRVGIDLLQISIAELNPHNVRKTHQFGRFQYDPGQQQPQRRFTTKYKQQTTKTTKDVTVGSLADATEENHHHPQEEEEEKKQKKQQQQQQGIIDELGSSSKNGTTVLLDLESNNDTQTIEMDAPWNQYAWFEELELRIHGFIPFGAPVESSSYLTRQIYGKVYKRTVPKARRNSGGGGILHWFLPSFFFSSSSRNNIFGDNGIDGGDDDESNDDKTKNIAFINNNPASSKPHAVIVDGSALQRVPGSLRHLSKCCYNANVPLYIVNDFRSWGSNTHNDIVEAAMDMRRTIKTRIIMNAMAIGEGGAFERGRAFGRLESETIRKVEEVAQNTRAAIEGAWNQLRARREGDWSTLGEDELIRKLMERGVIQTTTTTTTTSEENSSLVVDDNDDDDNNNKKKVDKMGEKMPIVVGYSDGFLQICRRCVKVEEQQQEQQQQQKQQQQQQHQQIKKSEQ